MPVELPRGLTNAEYRDWYRTTYKSTPHWKELQARLLRARPTCERCGFSEHLELHHLTYNRVGNERDDDLQVLCHRCHDDITSEALVKKLVARGALTPEEESLAHQIDEERSNAAREEREELHGWWELQVGEWSDDDGGSPSPQDTAGS